MRAVVAPRYAGRVTGRDGMDNATIDPTAIAINRAVNRKDIGKGSEGRNGNGPLQGNGPHGRWRGYLLLAFPFVGIASPSMVGRVPFFTI